MLWDLLFSLILKGEEYNPCSFSKVMQTLDELHKQLDEVKHQLNESSSKLIILWYSVFVSVYVTPCVAM